MLNSLHTRLLRAPPPAASTTATDTVRRRPRRQPSCSCTPAAGAVLSPTARGMHGTPPPVMGFRPQRPDAPGSRSSTLGVRSPLPAAACASSNSSSSSSSSASGSNGEQPELLLRQQHQQQQFLAASHPRQHRHFRDVAAAAAPAGSSSPPLQQQQLPPVQSAAAAAAAAPAAAASGELEQPPETGLTPDADLGSLSPAPFDSKAAKKAAKAAKALPAAAAVVDASATSVLAPTPQEQASIRSAWNRLMRWSHALRSKELTSGVSARSKVEKVVVFGGGSFGTAMGVALARQKGDMKVSLLLRDPYLCKDINELHCNTRYLKDYVLPPNVSATTSAAEAIAGAQYAIHAVPVQSSRAFLLGIKELLPPSLPIISVSKGVEVSTGQLMSDLIPSVLGKKQPTVFLSGPSFAKEVMDNRPTGVVAASKDRKLARQVQALFASPSLRVNVTDDVVGVEICGALKNVLAIAAGIVEGLELGHNAMAALISQGCSEIRWLAEKMHAKPTTISGLSGMGDIMLTCYGSLSRNRSVGVRLGKGERLEDILASSSQVAEGVATAGVVVALAQKYRVQLPVLTAVAQVLDGHISAREAVTEIMNLPQIEER